MKVKITQENTKVGLSFSIDSPQELIDLGEEPLKTYESSLVTWYWFFTEENVMEASVPMILGIELVTGYKFKSTKEKVEYFAQYVKPEEVPNSFMELLKTINKAKIIDYVKKKGGDNEQ